MFTFFDYLFRKKPTLNSLSIPKKVLYPSHLYKFIDFDKESYIKDILLNNSLYFSLPQQFKENDAFDCKSYNIEFQTKRDRLEWLKEVIENNFSKINKNVKRKVLKEMSQKYDDPKSEFYLKGAQKLNDAFKNGYDEQRICILCLTDSQSNEMWSQYIPTRKGVCIKLNVKKIVQHLFSKSISNNRYSAHLNYLYPIQYIDEPINISFTEIKHIAPLKLTNLLYYKLSCFATEREWRFIIYECINQSIKFPENIIEEVIFDDYTTGEQIKTIENWNKNHTLPFDISKRNHREEKK